MATCTVYHNSPGKGPGALSAQAAQDEINQNNPNWNVTHTHDADETVYTTLAIGVTGPQLEAQVKPNFVSYGYLFRNT